MKGEKLELVCGSGNVFRDLGRENADIEQLKSLLAAEIIEPLDRDALTVRAAHAQTGFAAADLSRIRTADLGRPNASHPGRSSRFPKSFQIVSSGRTQHPRQRPIQPRRRLLRCGELDLLLIWSGRGDLNARPPAPKAVTRNAQIQLIFNALYFKQMAQVC